MKVVVLENFGEPAQVLQVRDAPLPEPGKNQVRVRMRASPINPSDLLFTRGLYGRALLPATPGFEGMGTIDATGPGLFKVLRGLKPGRRVAVLGGANWQEYVIAPAKQVVPIPSDIPDEQAAAFFVNPATVLAMVNHVLAVPKGAWVLQTAAASALGKMVVRLGKHQGFRTINVIRRPDHVDELRRLGADEIVVTQTEDIEQRVRTITKGQGVLYALDAVGGATGLAVVKTLGAHGRLLVYGTLSLEPIALDPRLLIAGQKRVEGFWLSEWAREQGIMTMLQLFRSIFSQMRAGVLVTPVQATYPLDQIATAVQEADKPGRTGKILLTMGT